MTSPNMSAWQSDKYHCVQLFMQNLIPAHHIIKHVCLALRQVSLRPVVYAKPRVEFGPHAAWFMHALGTQQ